MANPTTNYGFVLPTATDLVTDLPADFDVALQGVDTRLKALQPGTTLGDLAYSSATANTNTRLGVGSTGQVLTVASGVPSWATPASGAIKQLVNGKTSTGTSTSSTSYVDVTGLSATITPTSASSKILVTVSCPTVFMYGNAGATTALTAKTQLLRGATAIAIDNYYSLTNYVSSSMSVNLPFMFSFEDSPATTSATTYKLQIKVNASTISFEIGTAGSPAIITLMEI